MAWPKKNRHRSSGADYRRVQAKIKPVDEFDFEGKVVLYGKAGTGKTTLAATFPKPLLLIDVGEKGTDSIRNVPGVQVLRAETLADIEDAYWLVKMEKKFKSVVIDTLSQTQDMAIREVSKVEDAGDVGKWGTMTKKQWGQVSSRIKTLALDFRDLPGINVIFIAHDRAFNVDEEDDETMDPHIGPRLMPSVASTVNGAVGIIGNTFIRERNVIVKLGKTKKEKRVVEYCLRIGPHSHFITKIRKSRETPPPALIIDPSYDKLLELVEEE